MHIFTFCLSRINTPGDSTGRGAGLYLGSGTCSCEEGTWLRGWGGNSPCWRLTRRARWGWRWAAAWDRFAAPRTFLQWIRCSHPHSRPQIHLRKQKKKKKVHKWKHPAGEKVLLVKDLPTNLTFHTRWGSSRLSGLKELILAHIWPNTDFVPSGPARPPLLRERFTCRATGGQNDVYVLS